LPLLDVPVYSQSTLGNYNDKAATAAFADTSTSLGGSGNSIGGSGSRSTMNILTYAIAMSINPHWMWCIGLEKGMMSHKNFVPKLQDVLQLTELNLFYEFPL
jgi:hypothetical protein